jgi:hypothetical protein
MTLFDALGNLPVFNNGSRAKGGTHRERVDC